MWDENLPERKKETNSKLASYSKDLLERKRMKIQSKGALYRARTQELGGNRDVHTGLKQFIVTEGKELRNEEGC